MLRKIRSGAVYSLFQANNIYQKLTRLDRKLAFLRRNDEAEIEEEAGVLKKEEGSQGSDWSLRLEFNKITIFLFFIQL